MRLIGVPSMRELMRIPVFNMDSAPGWGRTNESLRILNEKITPETRKFLQDSGLRCYPNGDLHHPHLSFTDQTYDGRYAYANDKANNRVCRTRLDVMKTDKIVEIPNVSGVHGLRPQRYPKTGYVFANGEHIVPVDGVGKWDDPKTWNAVYTAVDGETMDIAWQVLVDGNLDNGDADYQGKYSFSTCYNSERALTVQGASSNEQDWCVVFNLAAIEEGIKKGDFKEVNGVKMLDGRAEANSPYTRYIPVPNSPHGCNASPDGKYIMHNNYEYSKELLHYCLDRQIPFLYASSAATYGDKTEFREEREFEGPLNVYGYSKFLFDQYVRAILPEAQSPVCGFRYFNVYGPREGHKGSMASVAFHLNNQILKGENPKLFAGSEHFRRDFVYVGDVAQVNIWCWQNGISGIFNCGTGNAESFAEVAKAVIKFHGKGVVETIPFPEHLKSRYQEYTQADLTKLRATGYDKPFKTVAEGVAEYMAWLNK